MSEAKERLIREMAEARHFPFRGEEFSRRISDAIEALIDERIAAARRAGIRKWTPELVGKVEAMLNDPEDNWIIGDELPPKAEPPAGGRRRCAESPCPHCGAIAEPQPSAEAEGVKRPCACFGQGYCQWCRDERFGTDRKCHRSHPHPEPCPDEPQPPTPPSAGPIALPVRVDEAAEVWLVRSAEDKIVARCNWRPFADAIAAALNATVHAEPAREGRDTERFNWFFGPANKIEAMGDYFVGVQNKWDLEQWRAYCDRWMSAARAAEGKSND